MAAKMLLCRLCWENIPDKRTISIFTKKSLERGWPSRITALLDIPVSKDDQLPAHICTRCMTSVALEKACLDLAAFKKSSRACIERARQSVKRKKESTGSVGVSPDTLRERPRSKVARRLQFTSKTNKNRRATQS